MCTSGSQICQAEDAHLNPVVPKMITFDSKAKSEIEGIYGWFSCEKRLGPGHYLNAGCLCKVVAKQLDRVGNSTSLNIRTIYIISWILVMGVILCLHLKILLCTF